MKNFKKVMQSYQEAWKLVHLPHIISKGLYAGHPYSHVLPKANEIENFYPPIRNNLFGPPKGYLKLNHIKPHIGIHNLLSSWALCANMYWPFNNPEGKVLLAKYFKLQTGLDIYEITHLELEYEDDDPKLKPAKLLGEGTTGIRGSGQTSPDLAILFKSSRGKKGILLIESKFTEHSFYVCSGYKKKDPSGRPPNPNNLRCRDLRLILSSKYKECHLTTWGRAYWDLIRKDLDGVNFIKLKRCPMSSCCYQLFRQQALAKGFQKKYSIVASCIASDDRNTVLKESGKSIMMKPFPDGWKELFPNLPFFWLSHQGWFAFVKANNPKGRWNVWIDYIGERYFPALLYPSGRKSSDNEIKNLYEGS